MARGDRLAVGTLLRMAFRLAQPIHRLVRESEVDLEGGRVRVFSRQPQPLEQALGHAVVPLVLGEARLAPRRKAALPAVAREQVELLERGQAVQGGWGSDPKLSSHEIEGGALLT